MCEKCQPKVADTKPKRVDLEEGKTYYFCTCGESKRQPFCDGSHLKEEKFSPLKFVAEKTETKALCMCKQTKNPPYCDGSHRNL